MTFSYYLKLYLATLAVFLLVDFLWLGLIARGLYRKYLGYLLSPQPNWVAAVIFYLLFVAGLLVFAVLPGLQAGALDQALWRGALFGFFTYMTYDLTNLATIKNWPLPVTLIDIAWGVALASMVTVMGYLAGRWLV